VREPCNDRSRKGYAAKQFARDIEITAEVKAALPGAQGPQALEVSVQTYKGKAALVGTRGSCSASAVLDTGKCNVAGTR
jgi:osmotically-inducible protein OsmY